MDSVEVFGLCEIACIVLAEPFACGLGVSVRSRILWTGIEAVEIHAACKLLRLRRRRRADVAADVRHMGRIVAQSRNRLESGAQHDGEAGLGHALECTQCLVR